MSIHPVDCPLFSVIIPVFNVEEYIHECLDSVIAQDGAEFEIVAVNDGSTDGSGNILEEYARRDARVRVFHQENRGVAAARNIGISEARGEYLLFVDADDSIKPGALYLLSQQVISGAWDLIIFGFEDVDGRPRHRAGEDIELTGRMVTDDEFRQKLPGLLKSRIFLLCWNKVYRRSFLLSANVSFPSLANAEDSYLICSLMRHRPATLIMGIPLYMYRSRQESASLTRSVQRVEEEIVSIDELLQLWREFDLDTTPVRRRYLSSGAFSVLYALWPRHADWKILRGLRHCEILFRRFQEMRLADCVDFRMAASYLILWILFLFKK